MEGVLDSLAVLVGALGTAAAAILGALSVALKRRGEARAADQQQEIIDLQHALAQAISVYGVAVAPRRSRLLEPELRVLRDAFLEAGIRFVMGSVCADGRLQWVAGFRAVLGQEDVEGELWTTDRLVDAGDLEAALETSKRGALKGNRGDPVRLKTSTGAHLQGRLWSTPVRIVHEQAVRFFVVVFEEGDG